MYYLENHCFLCNNIRILNLKIVCSNQLESSCRCFKPGQVCSLFIAPVHSSVGTNEYLVVDNGGYLRIKHMCSVPSRLCFQGRCALLSFRCALCLLLAPYPLAVAWWPITSAIASRVKMSESAHWLSSIMCN